MDTEHDGRDKLKAIQRGKKRIIQAVASAMSGRQSEAEAARRPVVVPQPGVASDHGRGGPAEPPPNDPQTALLGAAWWGDSRVIYDLLS